jgi:MPBQ/MSBQ methyltransferase
MSATERMIRVYDRTMPGSNQRRYYEDSGYFNFGYWATGAKSQREACDALVDQLTARIAGKTGRILDVACGLGASTRRLAQSYAPDMVTGINISRAQIAQAQARTPGCTFKVMDAAQLDFPDNYFGAVICVEAAFHFDTRDKFLKEAHRVLEPGGSLVISDILFRTIFSAAMPLGQVPRANLVDSIDEYRSRLVAAGFTAVDVVDATAPCLGGFRRHLAGWAGTEYRAGRMRLPRSLGVAVAARLIASFFGLICGTYLLVSARKALPRD